MKIIAITPGINNCAQKTAFRGVWGERKFLKNDNKGNIICDYYEQQYHPFFEESEEQIKKTIAQKSKELESVEKEGFFDFPDILEMTRYCEHTKIKRAKRLKLTTLDCSELAEKYEMRMPSTLDEYSKLIKKVKNFKKIIK